MGTWSKGNTSDVGMESQVLTVGLIWSDLQSCLRVNHEMTQPAADCWPQNLVDLGPEDKGQSGAGSHLPGQVCTMGEVCVLGKLLMLSELAPLPTHYVCVF